ncbi:hypothetical protein G6F46_012065 [Rhizopus delemar]|uniref:MULE transposase domain-containing protein n=2 Tax=Rhizopus TaxID=4842 RepID=A0A9P7CI35_9FUNG|nr:hypothetical protein G6F55_012809 [Rhizopus delemar]KAG1534268.1 hypothetical protein G6F51_012191 [Rhizopus arrhizus]KAG1488734.1 hypothetical protein G6F54_011913 [Rhizopus delemar]KAG1492770.1 hypothetical protein G6F53_012878 [Rhizopus delemar]KAG1500304.1 hypothetical protein G6F52_012572 [Rhizopus delemar]
MSVSDTLRDKIKDFLCKGFSRREARSCLLQEMEGDEQQRNKMFHYDDVYNVWLTVAKDKFQFGNNEFESPQLWKRKLINYGYKVIDHSLDNVFFYGFISSWQMDIMKVSKCFSLDSTFGISSRSNEVLYSLVVRHPDTGKGVPVGYLLTNDQSVTPVLEWLTFFRDHCSMQPEKITVDCSIPEAEAIISAYPDCVYCGGVDSEEHFVWSCPFKHEIWQTISSRFFVDPAKLTYSLIQLPPSSDVEVAPSLSVTYLDIIASVLLFLWQLHWKFIFEDHQSWTQEVVARATRQILKIHNSRLLQG